MWQIARAITEIDNSLEFEGVKNPTLSVYHPNLLVVIGLPGSAL